MINTPHKYARLAARPPCPGTKRDKIRLLHYRIKEYKKGMNRQPKNWYVNKRKWNKKNK